MRSRLWAKVLVGLVLVASGGAAVAVVLAAEPNDQKGRKQQGRTNGFPKIANSRRIVIGPTSQADLAMGSALPVRISVPPGLTGTLDASIARAGESPSAISRAVRVHGGRHQLRLPVLRHDHLSACVQRQLVVTLRDPGGRSVAKAARLLAPVPPRCGRFFGPRSIWTTPIPSRAGTDKLSRTLVAALAGEVRTELASSFRPTINTTSFSAPVYTVPARQRRLPVQLVGPRVTFGARISAMLREGVPIPDHATAAEGTDRHLVVWQPATDTMWELFGAARQNGRWTATWAGKMDRVSRSPGYFYDSSGIQPGATATSLPLVGGLVTEADLARGEINHALAMAIPKSRQSVWSFPAQRSDGNVQSLTAIPQGARFRLDPSLDIASLRLPAFTAMLARAAQRYGIYVRDGSPVVTLYGQDPSTMTSDPWPKALSPSPSELLRAFPWERLQVLPMDLRGYSGRRVPH
jgi:hypothetical protein